MCKQYVADWELRNGNSISTSIPSSNWDVGVPLGSPAVDLTALFAALACRFASAFVFVSCAWRSCDSCDSTFLVGLRDRRLGTARGDDIDGLRRR
jgi:hypothetical protein